MGTDTFTSPTPPQYQLINYPNHFILFENVSLISRDQGLKQIFREIIEIKKSYSRIIP